MSALTLGKRNKLFGFVRSWFKKSAVTPGSPEPDSPQTTASPATRATARPLEVTPLSGGKSAAADLQIELPLAVITAQMSPELQGRVAFGDTNVNVKIPVQLILPQLAHGAVRIAFGELRAMAPGVFTTARDLDHLFIQLPLSEILPRISPLLRARKASQKRVEIPREIPGPFAERSALGFVTSAEATPETPATHQPVASAPADRPAGGGIKLGTTAPSRSTTVPVPTPTPPGSQPIAPKAPISLRPAAGTQPAAKPVPAPSGQSPAIAAPAALRLKPTIPDTPGVEPTVFKPISPVAPARPVNGGGGKPGVPVPAGAQPVSSTFKMSAAGATALKPAAPAAPKPVLAAPVLAPVGPAMIVPLSELASALPEPVRQEMAETRLFGAVVGLPEDFLEAGIKSGRVSCTWEQLRFWLRPAPAPDSVSRNDELELELPLAVLAPLFLKNKKTVTPQKRISVDASIPELFGAGVVPDGLPTALNLPGAKVVSSVADLVPHPTPAKPAGQAADTNYYVWRDGQDAPMEAEPVFKRGTASPNTDFLRRYATPNDIVAKAASFDGVAGAIIALPDGLMVANKITTDMNPETLAAFLPQIFARVSQCTKELRMGELNNLKFTVGNVPWKIFKVGSIFFAAFGRPGEKMPTAQLAALAAELDRKPI